MTALQQALDAIAAFPTPDDDAAVVAAKARGLLIGYNARWGNAGWETVSTEESFHLPLINPETGAASKSFTQAGRYDGIVRYGQRLYLLEHKTTSDDIADPNATYWRRLAIDSQVSAYVLANWQDGRKLDGTLYDVIRKPGIRPKKLSKADRAHIASSRSYCGYKVSDELAQKVAFEQERECPELYAMRLAADCVEQPERYFQRKVIPRLDSEVVEYAGEAWDIAQSILDARRKNAHYRNSEACVTYGTPCRFLGICSGHDNPDSDNWQKVGNVHDELPMADGRDSRSVLTNSRLKTFQVCRRKHQLHYELGIRRVEEEEREALFMGRLLHEGLRAWFDYFKPQPLGENHVGSRTTAAGECPAAGETGSSHETVAV